MLFRSTLVLDTGEVTLHPGDTVVQRGTSHAWVNRTPARARIAFTLIDGILDGDLQGAGTAAAVPATPTAATSGVRRVVTGHDAQGRSVVAADGDPPCRQVVDERGTHLPSHVRVQL